MASSVNKVSGGRGRGRAKALAAALNNPGENGKPIQKYVPLNNTSKLTEDVDVFKQIEEAVDLCLRETTPQNLHFCLSKADEFATDDEKIAKVVNTLIEKCLKEKRLAENGGQVAAIFISSHKIGRKFRDIFLQKFQEMYKNREQQRKTEFEKYLCLSVLLSSVFNDVRVNGEVMKILTKPVYTMLGEILDWKTEDALQRKKAVQVFRNNLLKVAVLLQETDKGQMEELFKTVRTRIIKETSPTVSCMLLQTFECYSSNNWVVQNETKEFYDELMNDISTKS